MTKIFTFNILKGSAIIVFALLFFKNSTNAQTATYWNGNTYKTEILGGNSNNFLTKARYAIFIPKGVTTLKGVLIHQHGCGVEGWGDPMVTDAQYQAFAKKWSLAILGPDLYPKSGSSCFDWVDPEDGSGGALLAGLDSLAKQSGHPELKSVPWLLWGHSGGGHWVLGMMKWFPERIIAAFAYSPGLAQDWNYPQSAAKIPFMVRHAGPNDYNAPGADCWATSLKAFSVLRSMGGLASVAYNKNQNHNFSFVRLMAIPFFESVLAQRLPNDGSTELKDMDQSKAWLVDTITAGTPNIYKASTFTGNKLAMSWLPDSACAVKFREYLILTYVNDISPPPAPTKIEIDTTAGNRNCIIRWEADADIESGTQFFNIYINGTFIARYPETGYFQTFDTNGDIPIPVIQPLLEFPIIGLPYNQIKSVSITNVNLFNLVSSKFTWLPKYENETDLSILNYTKELISCAGTEGNQIICAASSREKYSLNYQWYKDGVELKDKTSPILKFLPFDYPVSGIYKCKVSCDEIPNAVWSGDIPVYALSTPEITEQPKEVINAQLGGTYHFKVKAQYRGKVPPYLKDYFQWYKYDSKNQMQALVNDARIAGATSSELVITGLTDQDLCQKGDYYIVEIVSQCGTVRSNPFIISQKPEIVFSKNPSNAEVCPKNDVVMEANAIAPAGYSITYAWQKDNAFLTDNSKFNGVNTSKLQIFNVGLDEAGYYKCVAEIASEGLSLEGVPALLMMKEVPEATVVGGNEYSIKRGDDAIFKVDLIRGAQPLNIKWSYNGEVIKEGIWDVYKPNEFLTLILESINENQAGEYICSIENECAKADIAFNLTVKKWDETGVPENENSIFSVTPNPANDFITVTLKPSEGFKPSEGSQIQIYNTIGEKVMSVEQTPSSVQQINISALPVGLYFINLGDYSEIFVVVQ